MHVRVIFVVLLVADFIAYRGINANTEAIEPDSEECMCRLDVFFVDIS